MLFLKYEANLLPQISLIGKDTSLIPHKNIRRICEDYIFYIVTSGELSFCENGNEYTLKKGDCFLFEPGVLHYGTKSSEYNLIYIHFNHQSSFLEEISFDEWKEKVSTEEHLRIAGKKQELEKSIFIPKIANLGENSDFLNICNLAERAIENNKLLLANNNILCSLAISEMFIELYRVFIENNLKNYKKTDKIHLVNDVLKYLNHNYSSKITGEIISRDLCYNFDYLNQVFKKYLNTTIFKALERIRIEAAQNLMKVSNLSLEKIGESVGFKNESYFSKTFKKYTGITPSKYREVFFGKNL